MLTILFYFLLHTVHTLWHEQGKEPKIYLNQIYCLTVYCIFLTVQFNTSVSQRLKSVLCSLSLAPISHYVYGLDTGACKFTSEL